MRSETAQDRFERELAEGYLADLAMLPPISPEQRRRAIALCSYRCPDHGCDLIECEDVDEHGVLVSYQCPDGDHRFGSVYDAAGGYAPADDEIRVLAIDAEAQP